jgi:hypothetical protein
MKRILTLGLVLLGFNLMAQKPTVVTGNEKGWYNIGRISASFKNERESIVVMGRDEFSSIKLRVNDAPINIEHVQVVFEGGKLQDIEVKQPLEPGEETPEFALEADNKEIDKVVFTYRTVGNSSGEKAEVELLGYKSAPDKESGRNETGVRNDDNTGDEIQDEARETSDDVEDAAERTEEDIEQAADETGDDIERETDELRDNTKEHVRKTEAEITDRELEDKVGPNGQEIYIDDNSNYYFIDEQGNKNYVSPQELKDRERD